MVMIFDSRSREMLEVEEMKRREGRGVLSEECVKGMCGRDLGEGGGRNVRDGRDLRDMRICS